MNLLEKKIDNDENSSGKWSRRDNELCVFCVLPAIHFTFCFSRNVIMMPQLSVEQGTELVR